MWGPNTGYRMDELVAAFGESKGKVRGWVKQGLFGGSVARAVDVHVPEQAVVRFLYQYPTAYSLAKVDQAWVHLLFAGAPGRACKGGIF
jgi:hypothetical protein